MTADELRQSVRIVNERGLHARAAAAFVKCAAQYAAEVSVTHGDTTVSGGSIMGLMMLAAAPGSELVIAVRGLAAAPALAALVALVAAGFGES